MTTPDNAAVVKVATKSRADIRPPLPMVKTLFDSSCSDIVVRTCVC